MGGNTTTKARSQWWDDVLVSSGFATFLSAALSAAGISASLVDDDLSTTFARWLPWWLRFALVGGLFVLALALFFARQRVVDRRREEVQRSLEGSQQRLDELPDLVRTMPPEHFMQDLGIALEKCQVVANAAGDRRDEICESVRVTLQWVAVLARTFDGGTGSNTRFASNIMVFLKAADAGEWERRIKFVGHSSALTALSGVLALCCDLTATDTDSNDDKVPEIALPVPLKVGTPKDAGGSGYQALPGAPMAFAMKRFEHFGRAAEMVTWVNDYGNFEPDVGKQISEYFGNNPAIAGLFAVPLFAPIEQYKDRAEREVIGVLNVHWSHATRLRQNRSADIFAEAIFPLRLLLAQQLERLMAKGAICPKDAAA